MNLWSALLQNHCFADVVQWSLHALAATAWIPTCPALVAIVSGVALQRRRDVPAATRTSPKQTASGRSVEGA